RTVGFRLLVPLFGVAGRLASVRARAVRLSANQPKSVTPTGYATRGLFMADALARAALAGTVLGDGTPAAEALRQRGLVITEGEPDFLTWATRWSDANEDAPAVIGVSAGSWTAELAERIPQGCSVAVRTHTDAAGDAYANAIIRSISSKCPCFRLVPEVSHA
ncbi:MAG TPA: hypothetical protein VEY30_11405, partial [Myxococcaceae bacterium]|nr:hypothetical protein [Myxococcaceae bacterium]